LTGVEALGCDVDTQYECANLKCIPLTSVNNSHNDCDDNSDEGKVKHNQRTVPRSVYMAVIAVWARLLLADCTNDLAYGTICRPSVVCLSSVTKCTVTKRYVVVGRRWCRWIGRWYNLRNRTHNKSLINKTSHLNEKDFIIQMLYKDTY